MNDNLELYEKVRNVPPEARKPIRGGRLRGMTDINPVWRIKTLTEHFGPCGVGWYIEPLDRWMEEGADGVKAVFVNINLYVKYDGEWSMPIFGTGGSAFVSKEQGGLYTNDECFKMATTDAISVACKSLGIGADIYFENDPTKYNGRGQDNEPDPRPNKPRQNKPVQNKQSSSTEPAEFELKCNDCGADITKGMATLSTTKFGKELCVECQQGYK